MPGNQRSIGISTLAGAAGRGLLAGAVGTAAMTASSTLEARARNRGSSSTPAAAAAKVLGVTPTESGAKRFNTIVHWAYGTGWGAVRGLLGGVGLSDPAATLAHFAAVWGAEQVELPALGVSKPIWKYGATEAAIDGWHHAVYATATGLAYNWLARH